MNDRTDRQPARDVRGFSRPVSADDIPADGLSTAIEATPAECVAVAADLDLPAVSALSAEVDISRLSGGRLHVGGRVTARVTRVCVVTLEPFESEVAQDIDITFAPVPRAAPADAGARTSRSRWAQARTSRERPEETPHHASVEIDVDSPDPLVDGRFDLGAVAEEFLTLALDLYPRKPGVAFTDVIGGAQDEPEPSPFAALERFKDRS